MKLQMELQRPTRFQRFVMKNAPFRWLRNWAWVRYSRTAFPDAQLKEQADYMEATTGTRPNRMVGPHGYRKIPVLVLLATLPACESMNDTRLRTSIGVGQTEVTGEYKDESRAVSGSQMSGRVEISRESTTIPNVEVGLRALVGTHGVEETEDKITLELDSMDLGGAVVIRPYVDISEQVRAYFEGFAGYRHSWGGLEVRDKHDKLLTSDGNDGGLMFGAGGGFEIELSKGHDLLIGVEWSRSLMQDSGLKLDLDDFSVVVGHGLSW